MKSNSSKTLAKEAIAAINTGNYSVAEAHALELVKDLASEYKNWELLGVIQMKLNKYAHALDALLKSADLSVKDESPHINLGVLYRKLGEKENAVRAYKKALYINPKSASGHNNLANVLRELSKLQEAESHAKEAIKLEPNYALAYSNLGLIQYELGNKLDEAKNNCERALQINPQFAEALVNLGIILVEMGDDRGAKICYEKALKFDIGLIEPKLNLGGVLFNLNEVPASKVLLSEVLAIDPENLSAKLGLAQIAITENRIQEGVDLYKQIVEKNENVVGPKARVALAILAYSYQNFDYCLEQISKGRSILTIPKISYKNEALYAQYICQLLEWRKRNPIQRSQNSEKPLLVIGESHALTTVGMQPYFKDAIRTCRVRWIEGCKQWKLVAKEKNIWNQKLELICNDIKEPVDILFTIGEIDCRFDQGIMKHSEKNPSKSMLKIINQTNTDFLEYIAKLFIEKAKSIIIQGVPYPKMTFTIDDPRRDKHLRLVNDFNMTLKAKAHSFGFGFLDVYEMTVPSNTSSREEWHIDDVHLRPDYIIEAFKNHLTFKE